MLKEEQAQKGKKKGNDSMQLLHTSEGVDTDVPKRMFLLTFHYLPALCAEVCKFTLLRELGLSAYYQR